jgi:DNA-directed RNA polymerase subunit RPC12/RpoP
MKCSFCGFEFDEKDSVNACKSCMMSKGCNLIRCPNCGYEEPKTPKWIEKLFGNKKK